ERSASGTAKTGRPGHKKRQTVPERKAAVILDPSRTETDFGHVTSFGCCIRDAQRTPEGGGNPLCFLDHIKFSKRMSMVKPASRGHVTWQFTWKSSRKTL